jgi:hypothetical protein
VGVDLAGNVQTPVDVGEHASRGSAGHETRD